jgi:hypothetical protein
MVSGGAGADRFAHGRPRLRFLVFRDPLGDEFGVVFHPSDQRGATRVLPGEAEEVEARHVGDATTMANATVLVEDRQLDPRVVGPVARRPEDGVHLELAAVLEADGVAVDLEDARFELDAEALLELARARADQRLASA